MQTKEKLPMDGIRVLAAACTNGVAGVMIFCLLPVLVGAIADHLQLDAAQIGQISAVYFGCYALMTLSSIIWIRRLNWRFVSIVGLVLVVAGLGGCSVYDTYAGITVGIAISGFGAAMGFSLSVCMVSDMVNPDRRFAMKMIPEQLIPAVFLSIIPVWILTPYGLKGLLMILAVTYALMIISACWVPVAGRPHEQIADLPLRKKSGMLVFMALLALLVYFSGFAGVWTFLERIADESRLDKAAVAVLLALSLISSGVSPVIAAVIGNRWGRSIPMLWGTGVGLASLFLLAGDLDLWMFGVVAVLLPGAVYVVFAYFMGMIAEADVSGRFAVLISSALAFGATLGPGVFGVIKSSGGNMPAYGFAAGMIILGQAMACFVNQRLDAAEETPGASMEANVI